MAQLKTRATVIDTVKLASEFQSLASATRDEATRLARESLQAQIDAIKGASSKRAEAAKGLGIKTSSGTVDDPIADAHVVVSQRRGAGGTTRIIVYVNSKIFNILDKGRRAGTVKQGKIIFPAYTGHTLPDVISGDPMVIRNTTGAIDYQTVNGGKVVMREGQHIAGMLGAHFYQATAEWVEQELFRTNIISKSGRSKLRLNQGDVTVYAVDRARFNI